MFSQRRGCGDAIEKMQLMIENALWVNLVDI